MLAHRYLLERVERGHQLTGAKPQSVRDIEHRRARRLDPSRAIARDGSAAAVARRRARESARRSRQHSCGISAKHRAHRLDCASDLRRGLCQFCARSATRFVQPSLIDSASTREAAGVDAAFLGEHLDHRGSPRWRQSLIGEQFRKRENAEAIDRGSRRRGLIGWPPRRVTSGSSSRPASWSIRIRNHRS